MPPWPFPACSVLLRAETARGPRLRPTPQRWDERAEEGRLEGQMLSGVGVGIANAWEAGLGPMVGGSGPSVPSSRAPSFSPSQVNGHSEVNGHGEVTSPRLQRARPEIGSSELWTLGPFPFLSQLQLPHTSWAVCECLANRKYPQTVMVPSPTPRPGLNWGQPTSRSATQSAGPLAWPESAPVSPAAAR